MFTSSVRRGKAFAAEQKIRELKTRLSKLHAQKLKVSPTKIIGNSILNMDLMKSVKYGMSPEEIESWSLAGERFRVVYDMHRIEETKTLHDRLDRSYLTDEIFIGEKGLVLAEYIKKKSAPGKFYKQSVQTISYFNKERTFIIRKFQPIDGIKYYWLKDVQNNR